jgi:hypothetical protein
MTISISDGGHLMVSYVDQRVAMDAVARLVQDDPPAADEFTLFPFDAHWEGMPDPVIGYSVPPALPV